MNTDDKLRDYLKKVTLELRKTQARLSQVEQSAAGATVAIVGLACRCPERVQSLEEFWELLQSGADGIGDFPTDRGWELESFYDPDLSTPGKSYVRRAGFLREAADFDAAFFGISPREALATDPQQRLLLETAWEALEHAGIAPASLSGSTCGVFIGLSQNNYGIFGSPPELEGYVVTGSSASVASGRIAYTLGLQGPAISVDTACSASLVALHLACQSLRHGECEIALGGGAAVMATPDAFIEFSRQRALSPDGCCKPFSQHANGTAWGEAAAMLVLERVADAERNGHRVLAIVRGSAVNQDGKSQGLTAPNGLAQQQVIRQALASAQLTAADVDAVEAHGTGTKLGDPIEAEALIATYGQHRAPERPLWLGSLKSNIGHTQAAAGAMGVIKLVLALQHELLPKSLHAEEPTGHVDWSLGSVKLLREAMPWKRGDRPRRAAVSSFGISGTNAHMILEEPPLAAELPASAGQGPLPFVISAVSEGALRAQAERLRSHLAARPELALQDIAHSLITTRALHDARAVLVARDADELQGALAALAEGGAPASGVVGHARSSGEGKVAFVFPGQGGQWLGMARELGRESPVFAEQMEACARAFAPHVDWSLVDALGDEAMLERIDVVQPVLFAVMVSLAALWRSQGIEPDAVIGHSQGEIAAAYVAGALTLEDAARVVCLRSRAMRRLTGLGGMAVVELPAEQLRERLARFDERLSIAAINSPSAAVVTGEMAALDALLEQLAGEKILARRVLSSVPGHCALTEQIKDELAPNLASLVPRATQIPLYSTVHAAVVPGEQLDASYWYRNARDTVRFSEALAGLLASGHRYFIEVSAHPVLTHAVQNTATALEQSATVVGTLRRERGGMARFLSSLGELFVRGFGVDWTRVIRGGRKVALPTYAFQRERYWLEAVRGAGDVSGVGLAPAEHPLLGASALLADGQGALFTGRLSLAQHKWLAGHVVHGNTLLPGTAFVELAWLAARRLGLRALDELILEAPLVLPESGALQLQLSVGAPDETGARSVSVHSGREDSWIRHATGRLRRDPVPRAEQDDVLRSWPPQGAGPLDTSELYAKLAAIGVEYGESFRGLCAAYRRGDELFAEVKLPESLRKDAAAYGLHPALLDAALHLLGLESQAAAVAMPFAWHDVELCATGASALRVRARRSATGDAELLLADESGEVVAAVGGLRTREVSRAQLLAPARSQDDLYAIDWVAVSAAEPAPVRWAVIGELAGADWQYPDLRALAAALESGAAAPDVVVLQFLQPSAAGLATAAHETTLHALRQLQDWLSNASFAALRLLVLTRGAVGATSRDRVMDLARAPLWGLLRSAQSEHPDRALSILDLEPSGSQLTAAELAAALAVNEPQLALRDGALRAPRLTRSPGDLPLPAAEHWSLEIQTKGTIEGLALVPRDTARLNPGEVRVAVRAAGLNFRDVLGTLGMYPGDPGPIGSEGAGVVVEVGADVHDLRCGDRVMGLWPNAFGPFAVAQRSAVVPLPRALSFVQGASVPAVFLTAFYGLFDLGLLSRGQRVLIHAAAGGVGMAAVQLARQVGAEVFATASPSKWQTLRELGLPYDHIASSRSLDFERRFRGAGIDVVLNSLAHEFTDASLRLLRPGGRFIDMSKTDVRDPTVVAAEHQGVFYRAFVLGEAADARIQAMLCELVGSFEGGALRPLPLSVWDVRRAQDAFRFMAQARHVGKIVLTIPQSLPAAGTVLITGGTGSLGALCARHLVARHGTRELVLCSRTGRADALQSELEQLGASVRIAACDVSQRAELEALLGSIPNLRAVIHTAGALADGLLLDQSSERVERVFAPKLDAAVHLHELTRERDLEAFVLFSSAAGVLGAPGQSNYAAANAFLDALAQHRRAQGLAACSIAWGYWAERSGMSGHLSDSDVARMRRAGIQGLSSAEGLALLDAACAGSAAQSAAVRFDSKSFDAPAAQLPPLLRGLARRRLRQASEAVASGSSFQAKLATLAPAERERALLGQIASAVTTVMGVPASRIDADRPLRELGLDSLMAVELRNRLASISGLRLPSTLLFDHPTPSALCRYLEAQLAGTQGEPAARPVRAGSELHDPIAIVAMSCRYPRGAHTPEDLWQLLLAGADAIGDFPSDRGWDGEALYDPDPDAAGKVTTCKGGFLQGALEFDPGFFGISPREALATDPQQRLLLETAWEVLERAGIEPSSLQGSPTGVFLGMWQSSYSMLVLPPELEGYLASGMAPSVASGRIAYSLGLQGPAVTLDTACSSSLVALHFACRSLRQGECDLALSGGATVMATPSVFVAFSRQRVMSPDGRCKSFSDAADGAGWSEGVGMLLLERLSDARSSGHPVLALVRGSAINQDGKSQGLTAPNGPAQEQVIRQALASAQLSAADIDAVEGHGTGTALGDPIEAQALFSVYGANREADSPLWLGSLKSNLGHTQAAAGVGGVIKLVLSLQHELLPKSLYAERPTRHVDWSSGAIRLLDEAKPWQRNGRPRRAAVSSFGISGTNAHVIVEEPPSLPAPEPAPEPAPALLPFSISATTDTSLREQAARLRAHLEAHPDQSLPDVAHSLLTTRTHFETRAVVIAQRREDLQQSLERLAAGAPDAASVLGRARKTDLAVLFTGQGSQRLQMGRQLYARYPAFRTALDAVCAELEGVLERPLRDVLFAAAGSEDARLLDWTSYTQPALFALEVAQYRLLESFGVRPQYLLGHSVGEIVAAHVADVLSLTDACQLVAARARLMQALPEGGAMVAFEASEAELAVWLEQHADRASIAALNAPNALVVSGDEAPLLELQREWQARGRKARRLAVSHAFHSPRMEPMLAAFERVVSGLTLRPAQIPIVSNVSGELARPEQLSDPAYWVEHARAAVRFYPGVLALRAAGVGTYLELGPQAALSALVREALRDEPQSSATVWSAMRRDRDEAETWLLALGGLYASGQRVDWSAVFAPLACRTVALPTYPFARERYWPDHDSSRQAQDVAAAGLCAAEHPLLGASVLLAEGEASVFTGRLSLQTHRWLSGHAVFGQTILPGTGFVELALAAAARVGLNSIEELTLSAPLAIPERGGVQLQLCVAAPSDVGTRALTLYSRPDDGGADAAWTRCASGTLGTAAPPDAREFSAAFAHWPPSAASEVAIDTLYQQLSAAGVVYGPAFRGLRTVYRRGDELFAEVVLPESISQAALHYGLHPALLDAGLHVLGLRGGGEVVLPFVWQRVTLLAAGATGLRLCVASAGPHRVSVLLANELGEPLGSIEALDLRQVTPEQVRAVDAASSLYQLDWPSIDAPVVRPRWVQLGTPAYPDLAALSAALEAGETPEVVVTTCTSSSHGAHEAAHRLLELLQAWVRDEQLASCPLVVMTRGAVGVEPDDALPDLASSTAWGLVRSAQTEHPDLDLRLLDVDEDSDFASALASREPQLALRKSVLRVPRLARKRVERTTAPDFARGTVLITGGSGALAGLIARHLVARHGVRRMVLCSRSGRADQLEQQLTAAGAEARHAACDVSQRGDVAALIASIPDLSAVIHTAGVLDDGVLSAQSPERIDRVFSAKLDGALHLHELTRELPLEAFVLFSSVAGVVGSPGQANYAAANSFLDALAQRRRAQGLPGTSLCWGYWAEANGMTAHLAHNERARLARVGLQELSTEQALAMFDAAVTSDRAVLVPARFDVRVFEASAQALPAVLLGLGRRRLRAAAASRGSTPLRERLLHLDAAERTRVLRALISGAVSAVTGVAAARVEPDRPLSELGLDSLTAVELRNQLAALSGLRLPATLLFDHPTPEALQRYLGEKLLGERASARVQRKGQASSEPVAIVAMSCRYPGGVQSPEDLWQLLLEGRDAITAFPETRGWNTQQLFDPNPESIGKTTVTQGGFLHEAADFDAAFFGIAPREALATDPQQRLLLETSWEVLERAGIDPGALHCSSTGVFVGIMYNDYAARFAVGGAGSLEGFLAVGSAASVASGRIAYSFGLQGPAITVDTACSSSLVTLHLACQALAQGECDLALAGGATVMSTPGAFIEFSRQRGLAADGRCKSFSAAADGVAWSEGVGMLLLERLSDAERHARPVLALVRGSAVNQDGKSQGLTAPNGPSQERVIAQALASASLSPLDIDAVEGHGTGTTLGDPIEVQALLAVYGAERASERPLWLGSLKSNVGHTQAAAGVGGVIKLVLALQHELLPRSLYAHEPTPHVDWGAGSVQLLRDAVDWKRNGRVRRAAVSSFGISGTNAHVIVEEAPAPRALAPAAPACELPLLPFVLSARSEAALFAQAARLRAHLSDEPELGLVDVAHSLAATRSVFDVRAVVLAADKPALLDALEALASGQQPSAALVGQAGCGELALLFSGQGSQRTRMGRELYQRFPAFRAALDAVFAELAEFRPTLREVMFAEPGSVEAALLDRTAYTQPALFALEVALYRLLEGWAVRPKYLLGHSVGEIAAAHVAGVMSLADACSMVTARARLMDALPEGGAMLSIEASEDELTPWLDAVSLAAVNGPRSVVVSGDEARVLELEQQFKALGRKTRRLSVSHAFHSARMQPMLEEFERVVRGLQLQPAQLPIVSNVTGELERPERFCDPAYWVEQVRATVRFYPGVLALWSAGARAYLELGPQPVLATLAEDALSESEQAFVGSLLSRKLDESTALLQSLAALHTRVGAIDWKSFSAGLGGRIVALPTYAFQRERYWLAPAAQSAAAESLGLARVQHPLLAASVALAEGAGLLFTGRLSRDSHAWLAEYDVFGRALLPGGAVLDMALFAAQRAGCDAVEELTLLAPLPLPPGGVVQIQLQVGEKDGQGRRSLALHSRAEELGEEAPWTRVASGTLATLHEAAPWDDALRSWPPPGAAPVQIAGLYDALRDAGLAYGETFRCLREVHRRGDEWFAALRLPDGVQPEAAQHALHPALFEAARQVLACQDANAELTQPASWRAVRLYATGATELRVRLRPGGEAQFSDAAGEAVAEIGSLRLKPLLPSEAREASGRSDSMYRVDWTDVSAGPELAKSWASLGEPCELLPSGAAHHADLSQLTAALDAGEPAPKLVVWPAIADHDSPRAAHEATARALALLQAWLGEPRLATTELAVLTRGALGALPTDDVSDLAHAALWGLLRAAQSEHPEAGFRLIDLDAQDASRAALLKAFASSEPQLAVRAGKLKAPRWVKAEAAAEGTRSVSLAHGSVLITGASGALAGLLARHLVARHGVRHLVLCSRSGEVGDLASELEGQGVTLTAAACDVSDRAALQRLLDSIPREQPLTAVFHTAGVTADALLGSQDAPRLSRVLAPKLDGAWNLHELTRDRELSAFVLFSSVAGVLGSAGQSNYAAANSFLDALAVHRKRRGLPAVSLAWGYWATRSTLSAHMSAVDRARISRAGMEPLSAEQGLTLLDAALVREEPQLVAARMNLSALRDLEPLPAMLRGLRRGGLRRVNTAAALKARLAQLPQAEQVKHLLHVIQLSTASITNVVPSLVKPNQPVQELGLDSLMALELRKHLAAQTGLRLASTLLFDYPTPAKLARHLQSVLACELPSAASPLLAELDRLETSLAALGPDGVAHEALAARLTAFARKWLAASEPKAADRALEGQLYRASDDELYQLIDESLSQ